MSFTQTMTSELHTAQSARNNHAGLEELDLAKEWAEILGNESELGFLAFAGRSL